MEIVEFIDQSITLEDINLALNPPTHIECEFISHNTNMEQAQGTVEFYGTSNGAELFPSAGVPWPSLRTPGGMILSLSGHGDHLLEEMNSPVAINASVMAYLDITVDVGFTFIMWTATSGWPGVPPVHFKLDSVNLCARNVNFNPADAAAIRLYYGNKQDYKVYSGGPSGGTLKTTSIHAMPYLESSPVSTTDTAWSTVQFHIRVPLRSPTFFIGVGFPQSFPFTIKFDNNGYIPVFRMVSRFKVYTPALLSRGTGLSNARINRPVVLIPQYYSQTPNPGVRTYTKFITPIVGPDCPSFAPALTPTDPLPDFSELTALGGGRIIEESIDLDGPWARSNYSRDAQLARRSIPLADNAPLRKGGAALNCDDVVYDFAYKFRTDYHTYNP